MRHARLASQPARSRGLNLQARRPRSTQPLADPSLVGLTAFASGTGTWARLNALQSMAGNAAVQRLLEAIAQRQDDDHFVDRPVPAAPLRGRGEPAEVEVEGGCDGLSLHGQANAKYNGGSWSVASQKVTTSDACGDCPPGAQCLHLTGTLVTRYSASVTITMPGLPDGLTPCEARRVRAFLKKVLLPHEKDHERRFKTYNGTTKNPLDLTGCGMADLRSQIAAVQAAEDGPRQAAANALSDAIDPFVRTVDCSDCGG